LHHFSLSVGIKFDNVNNDSAGFTLVKNTHPVHPQQNIDKFEAQTWRLNAHSEMLSQSCFSFDPAVNNP
jgi:hypothetical protein